MMFIIVWWIFSFTWIVRNCMEWLIGNDVDIVGECMHVI